MILYPFELEANLIQLVAVVIITTWFAIRYSKKMSLTHNLFIWGMMGHILMNVYWNAMLVIDGNGTYNFTACDAAAIGSFAIWASMFQLRWKVSLRSKKDWTAVTTVSVIFGIWNIVWWILWSGHFVVNIIEGISIVYLLFMVVYALEKEQAIRKSYKIVGLVCILLLVVFQYPVYASGPLSLICDWISKGIWSVFFLCICFYAFKDKTNRFLWLFALRVIVLLARFLTDGVFYSLLMMVESCVLVLMVLTFDSKKIEEVSQ